MEQVAYENETVEFPGKQSDERVLYVIAPHALAKFTLIFKTLLIAGGACLALYYLASENVGVLSEELLIPVCSGIVALALCYLVWKIELYKTRTYITDRRIVRTIRAFPMIRRKRTLFWTEASRAKASAPNLIFRLARVGTLEVTSKYDSTESVGMNDVFYFDDLANYVDKILHVSHTNPAEMASVKPFVPRPKGKRD